jgi:hypothetical protein
MTKHLQEYRDHTALAKVALGKHIVHCLINNTGLDIIADHGRIKDTTYTVRELIAVSGLPRAQRVKAWMAYVGEGGE